jgi:hypothetical protein
MDEIKVGDTVIRWLAGTIPMELKVTEVTDTEILCGKRGDGWMFDKKTGAEIDEELGWGPPPKFSHTGSFIRVPGVTYSEEPVSEKEIERNL